MNTHKHKYDAQYGTLLRMCLENKSLSSDEKIAGLDIMCCQGPAVAEERAAAVSVPAETYLEMVEALVGDGALKLYAEMPRS